MRTLEEEILLLQREGQNRSLSIADILRVLSRKGRTFILILLSLPFCQPIQIPGLSMPFGLVVAMIGLRMTLGKRIWLPKKLLRKTVPSSVLHQITEKALQILGKMRRWIYPRVVWLCRSSLMVKMNGALIFILGLLLALPLPVPLSNLTAGWSILCIAFGILTDDGLLILIGYLMSLLTLIFFILIALGVVGYFHT